MRTYLLYIRKYSIIANDYVLYVYKVTTDNIYRIIGKIVCTSMEHIKRIDFNEWLQEREDFWKEQGYEIYLYREPKLSSDLYPLNYVNRLESENKKLREINHQMSVENRILIGNADNAYQQGLNEMRELVSPEIRKETAKEILQPLRKWLVDRFNYFSDLQHKNKEKTNENYLFDMGECDMANCTLDIVNEKMKAYGVEVEE